MSSPAATPHDVDALARALYSLSALRRDLQRCAGIEHAVAALAMLVVVRRIGPARISDLAHEAQVDLSVASRQIHALEADDHVARVPDPDDGRSSLIAITATGDEKLRRAHGRLSDALASATADWGHDDVVGLADGLVRLHVALGTCAGAPGAAAPRNAASSAPATPRRSAPAVAASILPAVSAADPTLTSAPRADAHHEEHTP